MPSLAQDMRVMNAVAGASPWGLRPIARPVDVTDAEQFPEIAAAIEHARMMKEARHG